MYNVMTQPNIKPLSRGGKVHTRKEPGVQTRGLMRMDCQSYQRSERQKKQTLGGCRVHSTSYDKESCVAMA